MATSEQIKANTIDGVKTRKALIDSFITGDNLDRKLKARKWFDIYKDGLPKYVEEALLKQTDGQSVAEMMNRHPNINLAKKIIQKKARVYLCDVTRSVRPKKQSEEKKTEAQKIYEAQENYFGTAEVSDPEKVTAQVQVLSKVVKLDNTMKRINKMTELMRNCLFVALPYESEEEPGKFGIRLEVKHPGQYDLIPDDDDPTCAAGFVFNDGWEPGRVSVPITQGVAVGTGTTRDYTGAEVPVGTNGTSDAVVAPSRGEKIGPSDDDRDKMRLIWWGKDYHFTTNGKGDFKDSEDFLKDNPKRENPIGTLPGVVYAKEQDGEVYARGGDDLIDMTLLINVLLTDINYIGYLHGTGVFYYIGPNAPARFKGGPAGAIVIKTNSGETGSHSIGFASPTNNLESLMTNVEQNVAMLLSTNDLEPSSVSTKLTPSTATSGIHQLIKGSELTTSIEDEFSFYGEKEQSGVWKVLPRWVNHLLKNSLADKAITTIGQMPDSVVVDTEFTPPAPFVSEKEQIENIKAELNAPAIITMKDAIKKRHPDWDDSKVEEYIEELNEEKEAKAPELLGGEGEVDPVTGKPIEPKPEKTKKPPKVPAKK